MASGIPAPSAACAPPRLALDDVPFSVLVRGLQSVRRARSRGGRKARAGGGSAVSVNAEFKRVMDAGGGGDFELWGDVGGGGGTKYGALDLLWKEVYGYWRKAEARRREADGVGEAEGQDEVAGGEEDRSRKRKREDAGDGGVDVEGEHFGKATALPLEDTVILLSLASPSLDEDHPLFSMKEKKLAEHYISALDLLKNGKDAQWLLNYMNKDYRPNTSGFSRRKKVAYDRAEDGNFFSVLEAVLCERAAQKSQNALSIGRAWRLFGTLCANRESHRSGYASYAAGAMQKKYGELPPGKDGLGKGGEGGETEIAAVQAKIVSVAAMRQEKKDVRLDVFRTLVKEATADENAEFARLIVLRGGGGAMRDELKYETLLNWFHPSAKDHYKSAHNIRKLVRDCRDPDFKMGRVDITPGSCANVMLTARPLRKNLKQIADALATGNDGAGGNNFFYIEPKLDGERMQLHKIGNEIITFTRNSKESTALYADLLRDAVCTAVRAENAVLDGELMVWDDTLQKYVSFEALRAVVSSMLSEKIGEGELYTVKFMVFDIMYVDVTGVQGGEGVVEGDVKTPVVDTGPGSGTAKRRGQVVVESTEDEDIVEGVDISTIQTQPQVFTDGAATKVCSVIHLPLETRRRILQKNVRNYKSPVAKGRSAAVEVIPFRRGRTEADLLDTLNEFVSAAYEGLIAKNPSTEYLLGIRHPSAGIKLKPDYFEGGLQDVDVIILGAKFGTSKGSRRGRRGTLSSFLIGVRSDDSYEACERQKAGDVGRWTPIGGVGTGYSYEQLEVLQRRLEGCWEDLGGRHDFPAFWDHEKAADNMFADMAKWIDPRKSVVLQVRAYELARRQGYALRFPRCDRIRDEDEKPIWDVISLAELVELDNAKTPAAVGEGDGNDLDAVGPDEEKVASKKKKTEAAKAIERVKEENYAVRNAGGGKRQVAGHQTAADVSDIKDEDRRDVLEGFMFVVYASHGQGSEKHELERQIYRLGGRCTQVSELATHEMAVDSGVARIRHARAKQVKAKMRAGTAGALSIVRPEWLVESEVGGAPVPMKRRHVFFANEKLERQLTWYTDEFGDPWLQPATRKSMQACFKEMDDMEVRGDDGAENGLARDDDVEAALVQGMRDCGAIFWGLQVWAANVPGVGSPLKASKLLLEYYGAQIVGESMSEAFKRCGGSANDPVVTHILVHASVSAASCIDLKSKTSLTLAKGCTFVSDDWVLSCLIEKKLVDPPAERQHDCANIALLQEAG